MGSLNCCAGNRMDLAVEVQEHRRTQINGLDQAMRSLNIRQNNYTRQIDCPNHETTFAQKIVSDRALQDSPPSYEETMTAEK